MTLSFAQYALAGNAIFTVQSVKTGKRFTFKIQEQEGKGYYFVKVLSGPDNENSYSYLGVIANGNYYHGKKSKIAIDAPSEIAFKWLWNCRNAIPNSVTIHFSGRCCRCGRTLTTPESIEMGIGPECASKISI